MNKITQDMRFKQAVIEYSFKHGVTKAAVRYKTSRQNIYRWRKKYDGTVQSLTDRSHRPHSHPNQHTEQEVKLVQDMRRRNPHAGLVVFWVRLRQRGYGRSISGLYKLLRRIDGKPIKLPNPKYVAKPYEQMQYPGQRGQIDVKYVPSVCLVVRPQKKPKKTAVTITSILLSRNTAVFAIWKLSRSRTPIPRPYS